MPQLPKIPQSPLELSTVALIRHKEQIKELFQSPAGKLLLTYLQELRASISLDVMERHHNDLNELNYFRGEVAAYGEIVELAEFLDKCRIRDEGTDNEQVVFKQPKGAI